MNRITTTSIDAFIHTLELLKMPRIYRGLVFVATPEETGIPFSATAIIWTMGEGSNPMAVTVEMHALPLRLDSPSRMRGLRGETVFTDYIFYGAFDFLSMLGAIGLDIEEWDDFGDMFEGSFGKGCRVKKPALVIKRLEEELPRILGDHLGVPGTKMPVKLDITKEKETDVFHLSINMKEAISKIQKLFYEGVKEMGIQTVNGDISCE